MSTSPYPHKHPTATSHNTKGHRTRMQQKLLEKGGTALTDLETLEMLLYAGVPRGEIKPLAKRRIKIFKSLPAAPRATPA